MLKIDTSGPLRSHTQLRALVEAIHTAGEHDELDWIEWKSALNLGEHIERGVVAFHILGMANRDSDVARRVAGGCGYIVVGVEPGNCLGIATVDPADLEPQIQRFLGAQGPTWQPVWVEYCGVTVLVVIVDPPSQGDPIWTLGSDFKNYRPGAVLVRRQGATHQATPLEIRRLTARAQPRENMPRLEVLLEGASSPLEVTPVSLDADEFEQWISAERERLLRPLEALADGLNAEANSAPSSTTDLTSRQGIADSEVAQAVSAMGRIAATMGRPAGKVRKPEDRSPEEYRQLVEQYLSRADELLAALAVDRHILDEGCTVALVAINPTDWPFREVEIELYIPGEGVMAVDGLSGERLPTPPRTWGDRWVDPLRQLQWLGEGLAFPQAVFPEPYLGDIGPTLRIDNSGSARVTFPPVNLAPGASVPLDEFHLLLSAILAGTTHVGTWTARSVHVPGVDEGRLHFRVNDSPARTSDLLERLDED
jgi:hypothetical protein